MTRAARLARLGGGLLLLACARPEAPRSRDADAPRSSGRSPASTAPSRAAAGATRSGAAPLDGAAPAGAPTPNGAVSGPTVAVEPARAAGPRDAGAELAPVSTAAPRGLVPLPLERFLPALVSFPEARRWPQPVLVAAHGAGDNPEAHCELWRERLGRRGVVLCLRGRELVRGSAERGYFFPDHFSLKREALAALEALAREHARFVDTGAVVYAGYSQGAQMGLLMLADQGARAPRLLLVEGGSGDFSRARARAFARSGGRAVAFVCGTPGCARRSRASRERLEAAGLRAVVHHVPGAGHVYWGPLNPSIAEAFAWLTNDDQRWAP